jgi:hypothetical protein
MKPKSLRTFICPYCRKPVEGGNIALLRNGGWAHATCKLDMEEARRLVREGARARDKTRAFAGALEEAHKQGHDAVSELLKKG